MSLTPRPYQSDVIGGIRTAFKNGYRAPLAVLPTGGGKTVIFCNIADNVSSRGKRALVLVHRIELLKQTSKSLMRNTVRHGLIHPQFTPDFRAQVQVASVQTLVKRLHQYREHPDLIIIDEAHHATAGTWRKIIEYFPNARTLGVTATPVRGDGNGLGVESGGVFDTMVEGPQISELIELGYLVQPVVYAPMQRIDLSGVDVRMGDYVKSQLADAVDRSTITGSAVAHYARLCPGVPAVAFCVSVKHAEHVAAEFRAAGFRAYAVDGGTDEKVRDRILEGLGNGSVDVVCSCDLISEGTDIPAIGCAILLRPTQSEGLYLQQVGRALRPCEGKDRAIILDHAGNVLMHGMPDENREWSLAGKPKRAKKKLDEEEVKVMQCTECYMVHAPAPACPSCGHVYPVKQVKPPQQVSGELVEVTKEDARKLAIARKREEAQADTLEALRELAKKRGYKPGWAEYRWQARQEKANRGKIILPDNQADSVIY